MGASRHPCGGLAPGIRIYAIIRVLWEYRKYSTRSTRGISRVLTDYVEIRKVLTGSKSAVHNPKLLPVLAVFACNFQRILPEWWIVPRTTTVVLCNGWNIATILAVFFNTQPHKRCYRTPRSCQHTQSMSCIEPSSTSRIHCYTSYILLLLKE